MDHVVFDNSPYAVVQKAPERKKLDLKQSLKDAGLVTGDTAATAVLASISVVLVLAGIGYIFISRAPAISADQASTLHPETLFVQPEEVTPVIAPASVPAP